METKRLEVFVEVVNAGGFRAAAGRLYLSQPAISQQIARLEQEIGVQLLDRSVRPTRVTAAGREFYGRCLRVLEGMRSVEALFEDAAAVRFGRVRIGLDRSLMHGDLPGVIRAFRERYPSAEVELRTVASGLLGEELESGRIDLGIGLSLGVTGRATSQRLSSEPLLLCLPARHPLTEYSDVSFVDLRNEAIILRPREEEPENHDAVIVACMAAGFSPRGVALPGSYLDHVGFTAGGYGLSLIPRSLAQLSLSTVRYLPFAREEAAAITAISWVPDRLDGVSSLLLRHCVEHFGGAVELPEPAQPSVAATAGGRPAREGQAELA